MAKPTNTQTRRDAVRQEIQDAILETVLYYDKGATELSYQPGSGNIVGLKDGSPLDEFVHAMDTIVLKTTPYMDRQQRNIRASIQPHFLELCGMIVELGNMVLQEHLKTPSATRMTDLVEGISRRVGGIVDFMQENGFTIQGGIADSINTAVSTTAGLHIHMQDCLENFRAERTSAISTAAEEINEMIKERLTPRLGRNGVLTEQQVGELNQKITTRLDELGDEYGSQAREQAGKQAIGLCNTTLEQIKETNAKLAENYTQALDNGLAIQ